MGNTFLKSGKHENSEDAGGGDRKRKREDENSESEGFGSLELLNTPKRKRIKSTSKYIYQTLFLDGENSDVTIQVLGKDWKLHKLYLRQCAYFTSMFSGSWKESSMETIEIDVLDDNITEESLKIAFGSLYKDDIFIKPVQIVGVLATATLLQLDGLIEQCTVMMTETLSSCTVCVYHSASVSYGLEDMRTKCFDWLLKNLLVTQNITFIKDMSPNLMQEVLSSPYFCVMQVEIDIYTMLKKWLFLLHDPTWSGSSKDLSKETEAYIKNLVKDCDNCYLEREEGRPYIPVFSSIRWHHVINDMSSINLLETDRVLPIKWLDPMFLYGWRRVLSVEQGLDKGPVEDVEESIFNEACTRCGRVLTKQGEYCWRWVGYSYGLDLLVSLGNRLLTIKRNTHTETCPQAVSLLAHRHLCYRMTISSVDKDGKENCSKTTGIKKISLGKDEEEIALVLDKKMDYPIVISMNMMLVSPVPELPIPKLTLPDR